MQKPVKLLTVAIYFALLSTVLIGCNKRDQNPELKDQVFAQLQKDMGEAKAGVTYVQDYINTNKSDLEKAIPQSGERAVYEKRINEGLNALTYANQQVRMYEVRIEERKLYVGRRYLESLTKNGRKWPDEEEVSAELQKLQLLREKTARVRDTLPKPPEKDVPRGTEGKAKGSAATPAGSSH
jgi:hypothetical protein